MDNLTDGSRTHDYMIMITTRTKNTGETAACLKVLLVILFVIVIDFPLQHIP